MRIKRFVALLLSICALLSVIVLEASAAEPTYEVSKQYKKSKYYENLQKVPLTGDQAADVVAIALSQLGYHEGDSTSDLGGNNANGTRDFVEYNVLYGKVDNNQGNGISYGYSWCASFVNWCLRQANVSVAASAAAEISCRRWLQKCKDAGIYIPRDDCAPQTGDMIFFKDADSQVTSTHIGIVLYATPKRVFTIEGNTAGGRVSIESYSLRSSYIVGYGRPSYSKKIGVPEIDYSGEDMSPGLYVSTAEIEVFDSLDASGEAEILPSNELFTVKEIYADSFRIEYDNDGKSAEGYALIENKAVQMTAYDSLRTIKYLDDDGSQVFRTQYLLPSSEIRIPESKPESKDARFVCWATSDVNDYATVNYFAPGDVIVSDEKELVLKAIWDSNSYTVEYKDENGTVVGSFNGYYGDEYEIPTLENIPEGKEFVHWKCQSESVDSVLSDFIKIEHGKITCNAIYTAVMRDIPVEDDNLQEYPPYLPIIGGAFIVLAIVLILVFRKKRK